jgi:hypothetical protein
MPPFDDQAAAALPRERIPRPAEPEPSDDRKREVALRIWAEALNLFGTIVETYLRSRSLTLPDSVAGRVIRFHPACPWCEGETTIRVPAMIAAMRSIITDEIRAVPVLHRQPRTNIRPKPRPRVDAVPEPSFG